MVMNTAFKKTILIGFVTLISTSAIARTVNFQCQASSEPTLYRFSGTGSVELKDATATATTTTTGTFVGSTTAAGKDAPSTDIGELKISGEAQIIPAGKFAVNEVIVLRLATERGERPEAHMMFNLGLNGTASSTLIIRGIPSKARCTEAKSE
jgi:hypothetical protein